MTIETCSCTSKTAGWTNLGDQTWVCGACRKPSYMAVWGPFPVRAPRTGKQYAVTEGSIIPHKYQSYICTCVRDHKVPSDFATTWHPDRHYATCVRCRKMTADRVFECEVDSKPFVKDYNSLAFCKYHPRCWDHLDMELETPECGCRPTDWTWSEDCPQSPWTNLNAPPPDISDFDPFAPLSF